MPACQKHPQQMLDKYMECNICKWHKSEDNKRQKKVDRINEKKAAKRVPSERDKLKVKLQRLHSKRMKELYRKMGFYYCWIDEKGNERKGLFGLHVSHYFAKGELWQLWTDPVNSGLSSYNRNVNRPETVPLMRAMMVKVWGEEKVKDLEKRAAEAKKRIDMRIDPKYPTELWLRGKIDELQKLK